jgi:nicotinamidase-related amidase
MTNKRETSFAAGETALLFVDVQKIFCTPGIDLPILNSGRIITIIVALKRL